jgi:hypothetical protein
MLAVKLKLATHAMADTLVENSVLLAFVQMPCKLISKISVGHTYRSGPLYRVCGAESERFVL